MAENDPQAPEPARQVLHASEEHFRLLVESIRDYAIYMLDATGHVLTWNLGAERIKGYSAAEVIGRHFSIFYPPEDVRRGKCEELLAIAVRDGRVENESWRVRKDGSRFWGNVVITALRDPSGALLGFAKVTRDLTERRAAEEERVRLAQLDEAHRVSSRLLQREREARQAAEEAHSSLATTLQSIGDAVVATNERGEVTLMNPIAERLTGWKLAEAKGQPLRAIFEIVNEQTRSVVESPVDRVLREGAIVGLANHTVLIARDGSEAPIHDSGAPIRDASGAVRGAVLVFRDNSKEAKGAAQRDFLAEATRILASSLDYKETLARVARLVVPRLADWCSVEVVEDGNRLSQVEAAHVDPQKAQLARDVFRQYPTDLDSPAGVGHVIRTGRAEHYPKITNEMLTASIQPPELLRILLELKLRSCVIVPLAAGTRVLGAITMVLAESGRSYTADDLAFAEEIGRRAATAIENARLYAAEQKARDAADAASRAKDEFLALVSHELRTPLSSILGWAQILAEPDVEEPKRARAVSIIERNAVAMAQLIEDLLDVSRIVNGKVRLDVSSVPLSPVVDAALESLRPAADAKSITVAKIEGADVGSIHGDAARMQQVVWNLVSNAVKFTPAGGRVTVDLQRRGDHVEIVVSDTGKGIEPRFLPHVFETFRQADGSKARASGGLGLGLAIVKLLVELHGGNVEAQSDGPGSGATFTVRLPAPTQRPPSRAAALTPPAPRRSRPPALPHLAGLRVLAVEDEPDMRELLREMLTDWGCDVMTASSVAEALALLERGPAPNILLSDISMPGETGYDLIRRLRALPASMGSQIPAAALTAYTRAEDRRGVLAAGFDLHVPKPIDPAELASVLATLARLANRHEGV